MAAVQALSEQITRIISAPQRRIKILVLDNSARTSTCRPESDLLRQRSLLHQPVIMSDKTIHVTDAL